MLKRALLEKVQTNPVTSLAYLEMRLIMARMLWNFDLELADQDFEWTKQKAFIVWEKEPLMVQMKNIRRGE
jgi:cytochrome P450